MSAARSRAAAITNLARSSLALPLRASFGPAKSCAVVNFFIDPPPDGSNKFAADRGHLMTERIGSD
jgi:hypothetical protein